MRRGTIPFLYARRERTSPRGLALALLLALLPWTSGWAQQATGTDISYGGGVSYVLAGEAGRTSGLAHEGRTSDPRAARVGAVVGTVTDGETGEPIPGVNVVIEGTQQGGSTDIDGAYAIRGVEAGQYTLVASFVGYADATEEGVQVEDGETTTVDFALRESALGLDELVVVGYGTQQRRDITGAISTVSPSDLQQIATTSLDQGLQGQVAGVQVTQVSGAPGASPQIRIRGGTSINAGNNPLYVIDGFPVYGTRSIGAGATQGGEVNPLATLNPQDIESIQVLKDASATAIYGARGANGVVVITTKGGSARSAQVNFTSSVGVQNVRKTIDVLGAMEFAELTNTAYANSNQAPFFSEEDMAAIRGGQGTNWQDEIFDAAPVQDYGLSVSGGTDAVRYAVSGGYLSQDGIVVGSDFERLSLRANLDSDVSARFRVGSNLSVSRTDANLARTPAAAAAAAAASSTAPSSSTPPSPSARATAPTPSSTARASSSATPSPRPSRSPTTRRLRASSAPSSASSTSSKGSPRGSASVATSTTTRRSTTRRARCCKGAT